MRPLQQAAISVAQQTFCCTLRHVGHELSPADQQRYAISTNIRHDTRMAGLNTDMPCILVQTLLRSSCAADLSATHCECFTLGNVRFGPTTAASTPGVCCWRRWQRHGMHNYIQGPVLSVGAAGSAQMMNIVVMK